MTNQIKLVAAQVYRTRIKTFGFWAMVVSPLIVPFLGILISMIVATADKNDDPAKLAVVSQPQIAQVLKTGKVLSDTTISQATSITQAKKSLNSGKIDGYLTAKNGAYTLVTAAKTTVKFDETTLRNVLTQIELSDRAKKLNLTAKNIADLLRQATLSMKTQSAHGETSGGDAKNTANHVLSMAIGIIIFMFVSLYVGMMSQEIANEKSNRIMEMLLAATSAKTQFRGKIYGILALVLTQVLIYLIAIAGIILLAGQNDTVKLVLGMVKGIDLSFVAIAFVMIVTGVFGYLILSAIVASLVNDQSQVQQAAQPVMYLSLIGYIASFLVSSAPGNKAISVLSYVPFISPTLMPSRLAIQYATTTQALIAVVLQIAGVIVVFIFGEKLYARNVLSYSDEKIIRQLVKNLKNLKRG
ncbi:ABC transporter permease [Lactococcus insecticola]|uniref:ABC transporter permease n=1 Tax=Pseudolactococcus insecticola TaxID=2709158 RepID=A0A6A0B5X3_9LACT|nr:ABC transporter permease [Lactococcus insecticola]GFH39684.1 ABC transporter permease [Lactococcus insecticola]